MVYFMISRSYELIPTADRDADLVSQMHGFENITQLAASLPEGANILEVGSGASPFGKEVATLRPDITWTNFDYSYYDQRVLDEVSKDAPGNIHFVKGDATKLSEMYEPESFDAIFSYWMMPHLSLDDPEPAKEAARGMFSLAKINAPISIGPAVSEGRFTSVRSLFIQAKAHRVVKHTASDSESFTDAIVAKTTLPRRGRFIQKIANEVITPLLGTSRWSTYENRSIKLYHRESGEYVSLLSKKGAHTTKEIVFAGTHHVAERHRTAICKCAAGVGILAVGIAMGRRDTKLRRSKS